MDKNTADSLTSHMVSAMNKAFLKFALLIMLPISPVFGADTCGPQRVALTFDDPPLPDTSLLSGEERTQKIIQALSDGGVDGAMFFAVSSRIDDSTLARMHAYAEAGHLITNHSHTHPNLHNVGAEAYSRDVRQAHEILSQLPGFSPYYRFPYLNEGNNEQQRDEIRNLLTELGYKQGYVTIDNYDFMIDRLMREAFEADPDFDIGIAETIYLDMLLGAANHYDEMACKWLGRSPAHVLLLHENDAAALLLPALIDGFRKQGWTIIPALEAYEDPIASITPDTLVLGQGRVAAIAAVKGAEPRDLRHEGEDTEVLREKFEAAISAAKD